MKLPSSVEMEETGDIVLNAAELDILHSYIRRIQDDRDHARAWAAFHQADSTRERHRLHLLMTFGRTLRERAEQIIGAALPEPAHSLAGVASDGWIGMMAEMLHSKEVVP